MHPRSSQVQCKSPDRSECATQRPLACAPARTDLCSALQWGAVPNKNSYRLAAYLAQDGALKGSDSSARKLALLTKVARLIRKSIKSIVAEHKVAEPWLMAVTIAAPDAPIPILDAGAAGEHSVEPHWQVRHVTAVSSYEERPPPRRKRGAVAEPEADVPPLSKEAERLITIANRASAVFATRATFAMQEVECALNTQVCLALQPPLQVRPLCRA